MRKWIAILLVCSLLALTACGPIGTEQETTTELTETTEATQAVQPTVRLPMHNMEPGSGCYIPDTWD